MVVQVLVTIGKLDVNCVIQVPSMEHFCSGGQTIRWEGVNFRFYVTHTQWV